jgi:DNA-binding transcriptional MerR regulator
VEVPVKTDPDRAEQDEQILRLRCAGLSLRAIASRVGLSHQGVSDRIEAAIRELVDPRAEEWRALETARLDDLTQRAYEVLDGAESGETALKAIAQLERLSASRRKLWALDMPQPVDVALSGRLDLEGELVGEALRAAFDALELSPDQKVWAAYAASAALHRAAGQEPPAAPPPAPVSVTVDAVGVPVEEPVTARAGMEARLRDLTADEDVDVDALLAEVDGEGQGRG